MIVKIDELLQNVKKLAISGHVRPDGDCVGSCLGLYNYVTDNYSDIDVHVFMEDCGQSFSYIRGFDKVEKEITDKDFDLFISLDTSDAERIGIVKDIYTSSENTVCIDHHISNKGFAKRNYIEADMSSCSEVLYNMLDDSKISKEAAEALYTGIIHDTGVFKYESTSEDTMKAAGRLMSKGIDKTKIIDEGFYSKSYNQNQILGRALLESILILNGKCIFSVITKANMDFYDVKPHELGGIVEQLRLTEGVECAIFLYETAHMEYKVSLRSKNYVDVNQVASYFAGGGHIRAAGCTMRGTTHDVINNIVREIEKQI